MPWTLLLSALRCNPRDLLLGKEQSIAGHQKKVRETHICFKFAGHLTDSTLRQGARTPAREIQNRLKACATRQIKGWRTRLPTYANLPNA
jgi:hypothetical protein